MDCSKLIQEFHEGYRKHLVIDAVQVALWSATAILSFGVAASMWVVDLDEQNLEGVIRTGAYLLEAAREGDVNLVMKSAVLQDMYAV